MATRHCSVHRSYVTDPPVFDTGGHLSAIEGPALLVGGLRRFFRAS
jgi:hypothetical protein